MIYQEIPGLGINREAINWKELINQTLEDQKYCDNFEKINIEVVIDNHDTFFSDKRRLSVIFNNLISNAIRYSDLYKQVPGLTICVQSNQDSCRIIVKDNGIGIKSEHLSKIFKMFYRAHEYKVGSGLGLYICQETIGKLHGRILVESEVGRGTTFTIDIPALRQAET